MGNRVAVIVQNSIKTVFTFRISYIEEMMKNNFDVVVIAPLDCSVSYKKLVELGVVVPHVSASSFLSSWFYINLQLIRARIRFGRDAVFICHFLVTALLCWPALILFSKRLLSVEGMGSFFSSHPRLVEILRLYIHTFFERRLFTNSSEIKILGTSVSDRVFGGIGINLGRFSSKASNSNINSASKEKIRCLYVGRLVADKGIEDCFSVVLSLINQGVDVTLDVVGDLYPANPTSLSKERILEIEKKTDGRVIFHGYSSDVKSFYHHADLLLLLSKCEGFPVVVMEASASGVPTIAYRVPGCEDAVCEGKNGFLVNYGDIPAVSTLIRNSDFRSMAASCRAYAVDNFDARIISNKFVEEVEALWKKSEH